MHAGGQIAPGELIEFDNNLVGVRKVSKERNEVKGVLVSLALMEEILGASAQKKKKK